MVIELPNMESGNRPPTIRILLKVALFDQTTCDFSDHILIPHVGAEMSLTTSHYHKIGEIAHSFRDNACHALDDHARIFLGPGFFRLVPERCKKPLILQNLRPLAVYGNPIAKYGRWKRAPYHPTRPEMGLFDRNQMLIKVSLHPPPFFRWKGGKEVSCYMIT